MILIAFYDIFNISVVDKNFNLKCNENYIDFFKYFTLLHNL